MRGHPKFRSTLTGGQAVRTYKHVNIGIARALPNDELITALVPDADRMSWPEYARVARARLKHVRGGEHDDLATVSLVITHMGGFGLRTAVPVVSPPAAATLCVGAVYPQPVPSDGGFQFSNRVMLSLTFDHRLINGVGASAFLNEIKESMESFSMDSLEGE